MLVGMRRPVSFFVTRGIGESDVDRHTGSFHVALESAGIAKYNIMKYSSILPAGVKEIPFTEGAHGAVMETIMSEANGVKGDNLWAGVAWGMLVDMDTKERIGGIVVERNMVSKDPLDLSSGHFTSLLHKSLDDIRVGSFKNCTLVDVSNEQIAFHCASNFGTALVALCFVTYEIDIIDGGLDG